jgi:hypothetical protein
VAAARPSCLYCGAALPEAALAAARAASVAVARGEPLAALAGAAAGGPAAAAEPASRTLLVVRLEQADATALAQALDLTPFEAQQWRRRGGWQLVRIAAPRHAEGEVSRLAGHGLEALAIPEAEARAAREPIAVSGGSFDAASGVLGLELAGARLALAPAALLLAVAGPIAREYQAEARRARWARTAELEEGYRVHLHRREEPRALELDPASFRFSGARRFAASARLELDGWLASFAERGVTVDGGFRRMVPELALAEREQAPGALELGRGEPREGAAAVLDNLAQFRFYSGWRCAVARRISREAARASE